MPHPAPDLALATYHRNTDAMSRGLMTAYAAAHATLGRAEGALREHMGARSGLAGDPLDALVAGCVAQAEQVSARLSTEELLRQLKTTLEPLLKRLAYQVPEVADAPPFRPRPQESPQISVKARQARLLPLFDAERVSGRVPAVLLGPPPLVDRALAVVRQALAAAGLRRVWCPDAESAETATAGPENPCREVILHAPWTDIALVNVSRFRALVDHAEKLMGGPTDALAVADLARPPRGLAGMKGVPQDGFARAAYLHHRLRLYARGRGVALVAGLKTRPAAPYSDREVERLAGQCQLYTLAEADGRLTAADSVGQVHPIAEPP